MCAAPPLPPIFFCFEYDFVDGSKCVSEFLKNSDSNDMKTVGDLIPT